MTDREKRIARARTIAADLYAAGGWDLRGYEDFIVDLAPEVIRRIFGADIPDGTMAIEIAGKWHVVGRLHTVSVKHHYEEIETLPMSMSGGIRQFGGLQSQTIDVTMAVSDMTALEFFHCSTTGVRTAFRMQGKIFGAEMFSAGYDTEIHSMTVQLSLIVNGKIEWEEA